MPVTPCPARSARTPRVPCIPGAAPAMPSRGGSTPPCQPRCAAGRVKPPRMAGRIRRKGRKCARRLAFHLADCGGSMKANVQREKGRDSSRQPTGAAPLYIRGLDFRAESPTACDGSVEHARSAPRMRACSTTQVRPRPGAAPPVNATNSINIEESGHIQRHPAMVCLLRKGPAGVRPSARWKSRASHRTRAGAMPREPNPFSAHRRTS